MINVDVITVVADIIGFNVIITIIIVVITTTTTRTLSRAPRAAGDRGSVATVAKVLDLVDAHEPVLGGVGLLEDVQLEVLVADLDVPHTVVACGLAWKMMDGDGDYDYDGIGGGGDDDDDND